MIGEVFVKHKSEEKMVFDGNRSRTLGSLFRRKEFFSLIASTALSVAF